MGTDKQTKGWEVGLDGNLEKGSCNHKEASSITKKGIKSYTIRYLPE